MSTHQKQFFVQDFYPSSNIFSKFLKQKYLTILKNCNRSKTSWIEKTFIVYHNFISSAAEPWLSSSVSSSSKIVHWFGWIQSKSRIIITFLHLHIGRHIVLNYCQHCGSTEFTYKTRKKLKKDKDHLYGTDFRRYVITPVVLCQNLVELQKNFQKIGS